MPWRMGRPGGRVHRHYGGSAGSLSLDLPWNRGHGCLCSALIGRAETVVSNSPGPLNCRTAKRSPAPLGHAVSMGERSQPLFTRLATRIVASGPVRESSAEPQAHYVGSRSQQGGSP